MYLQEMSVCNVLLKSNLIWYTFDETQQELSNEYQYDWA